MADGSLCTLVTPLNPKSALKNSPDSAVQTNSHVELAPCGTAEPRRDAAMCLSPSFLIRSYLLSIGPLLTCVYGCPIEECLGRAADWVKGFVPSVCWLLDGYAKPRPWTALGIPWAGRQA